MAARKEIDARGWIGIGVYALVLLVLFLMWLDPTLRQDEFFKTISTLIFGAFIKDVVGWAYQATKGGGELAERNARVVEDHARTPPPPPPPPGGDAEGALRPGDTVALNRAQPGAE